MEDRVFSDYIIKRSLGTHLNDEQLDAIQDGDMSGLLRCFYNIEDERMHTLLEAVFKSMERLVKVISLEDFVKSNHFEVQEFVFQSFDGDISGIIGFCGNRGAMRLLALDHTEREQELLQEDARIAQSEVKTVIRSLIASIFEKFQIKYQQQFQGSVVTGACFEGNQAMVTADEGFYILTFKILGKEVNMITGILNDGIRIVEELEDNE